MSPPYRPVISDRPRHFKMIPHARLFDKLRIRGPGAPCRYTYGRRRRPTPHSMAEVQLADPAGGPRLSHEVDLAAVAQQMVKLRLTIRILSFLAMRMPWTWIFGLPRLHRLPELRGPPEAQGVVRPVFLAVAPPFVPFSRQGQPSRLQPPFFSGRHPLSSCFGRLISCCF